MLLPYHGTPLPAVSTRLLSATRHLLTQGLYYLWLLPFAFFMCAHFCLPYNPGTVLPSPSQGLMGSASFPPVLNAQLGKVFASVTVFGGSVRCPVPRSWRTLQAMPPPSRTLPYSSASSSFEQVTGPVGFVSLSPYRRQRHKWNISLLLFLFLHLVKRRQNEL